ncbi:MAG: SGNH/GDSL hydrolase family protein [Planctomycetota bacterium]
MISARLHRILLACAATLVAFVAAEFVWRATRTAHFGPTTNPSYVLHDPLLGWRYRPGARVRHVTDEFDVAVAVNAQGFRDAAFPAADGADHPLIVALGDSQTFGWGVEVERAFPVRLGRALDVRVLNMGVSGYGTDQQLLLWRQTGRSLAPDIVVLTVCANDTREVYRAAMYGRKKPRFVLDGGRPVLRGVPVPRHRFAEWSHLLRSAWSNRLKAANPPLRPDETGPARQLQAALLHALAEDVTGAGARLLVVSQDEPWLTGPLAGIPGVLSLDVGPALAMAAEAGPVTFARDPHWNARGHAVVADAIEQTIRAAGWLP